MNETTHTYLVAFFQQRHSLIVDAWYRAIAHTSFLAHSGSEVRRHLSNMTNRITTILLTEPFNYQATYAVSADLTRLHYLQPEALKETLAILGCELVAELPADYLAILYPRMIKLLASISSSFFRQARDALLTEQEQIRSALFTERLRVEAALRESEERLRTVVNNLPIALFAIDRAGIFTLAEGKGLIGMGITPGVVVGRSILTTLRDYPHVLNNIYRAISGDTFTARVDIEQQIFETRYAPLRDQQGYIQGVIGVAMDITDYAHVEADLAETRLQLAAHIEAKQTGVGYPDQKGLVYRLLGSSYELCEIEQRIAQATEHTKQVSDTITLEEQGFGESIRAIVGELRQIVYELCPVDTDDSNLVSAIESYVTHLRAEAGSSVPTITLDLDQCPTDLPSTSMLLLFQVVRQTLDEACTDFHTDHMRVSLKSEEGMVVLHVFVDKKTASLTQQNGASSHNARFREIAAHVAHVGGHLSYDPQASTGTVVVVHMPLQFTSTDEPEARLRMAGG